MTDTPGTDNPVEFAANVIREALTCDRPQCTPEDHAKFVTDNMRIAHNDMTTNTR